MSNPHGPPRRVSLGYILGFSDRPFKDPKPPSPPQPRRPSQLTELVNSPGGIVEWTASDGRKGTLTGAGKPRLTAVSLAKIPSITQPVKNPTTAKDGSRKAASNKQGHDAVDTWDAINPGFVDGNSESKKSGSKKAPSKKEGAWGTTGWNGGGSTKASQKAASAIAEGANSGDVANAWWPQPATGAQSIQDKKKDEKGETKAPEQPTKAVVAIQTVVPGSNTVVKYETIKPDDSNAWTKEQDQKMLQMKSEDAGIAWKVIAENVGKPANQCKERWKVIMPSGWKLNDAKKKADKGDVGKETEVKTNHHIRASNCHENKKEEGKKEDKKADDSSFSGVEELMNENSDGKQGEEKKSSDWNTWKDSGAPATSGWDDTNTGGVGAVTNDTNFNSWGNWDGAGDANNNNLDHPWGQTTGEDPTNIPWGAPNQQSNGDGFGVAQALKAQEWPTAARLAPAPRSNKAPSESRSRHTNTSKSKSTSKNPAEIELEPDDNFSAEDLRLIARILQQDCSLVWNRVSWRFRDKTGRTLDPGLFEKKITGTVERKGNDGQSADLNK